MPRIARLYITIGIAVIVFLFVILILPKNSENKTIDNFNNNNNINNINNNNYNNYNKFKSIEKEFLKKDETNIEFNDQLIKPIDSRVKDNNNIKVDKNEEHLVPIIESLSLDIFKQSAQKYQNEEQKAIVKALKHSWSAYRTYAWGSDHLKPITKSKDNWFGVGLTLLDSLDTLVMMGLEEGLHFSSFIMKFVFNTNYKFNVEFNEALNWIKSDLRFDIYRDVNCFEMTIRALGNSRTTIPSNR